MPRRAREDQWILALQLAEPPRDVRVIGQPVVRERTPVVRRMAGEARLGPGVVEDAAGVVEDLGDGDAAGDELVARLVDVEP
jgi:hypothetical protein